MVLELEIEIQGWIVIKILSIANFLFIVFGISKFIRVFHMASN